MARHDFCRMRAVHADVPDRVIAVVNNGDVACPGWQHLKGELHCEGKWRSGLPALVLRIRKALACGGEFALLFHHRGREWCQDRIVVVADQPAWLCGGVSAAGPIL